MLVRVMPVLLLRGRGFVKGMKFDDHRYIGDPLNILKLFNEKGADEVVILDILASPKRQEPDFVFLESLASQAFMPLSYGGGISSLEMAKRIFSLGFEKVVCNTAIMECPDVIKQIATVYGSQAVVACVDVKKNFWGKRRCFIRGGRVNTGLQPVAFIQKALRLGVGEVIVQSIDRDGVMGGYDTDLLSDVAPYVDVPLVALGGARGREDFELALKAGADALGASSMFCFNGIHKAVLISYQNLS